MVVPLEPAFEVAALVEESLYAKPVDDDPVPPGPPMSMLPFFLLYNQSSFM